MNKLKLVFPCKYDFDSFPKVEEGSYCKHCHRTLNDYTKLTSAELADELSKTKDGFTCGKFRADQFTYQTNRLSVTAGAISLSILALLGFSSAMQAQSNAYTATPQQTIKKTNALDKLKFPLQVKGTLREKSQMPIAYSKVLFKQKGKTRKSAYTDAEGNFLFTLNRKDVLDTNFTLVLAQAGYKTDSLTKSLSGKQTNEQLIITLDIALCVVDYAVPLIDPDTKTGMVFVRETPKAIAADSSLTKKEKKSKKHKKS